MNIVFTFEGVELLEYIRLRAEEIQFCTTKKELDSTVIELTSECVKRFKQFGAKFIRVTYSSSGHECHEEDICIVALTREQHKRLKIMKFTIILA